MTTTVTTPILTAGTWTADTVHSDVAFKVRHMAVGKAKGTFDLKSATLVVDENGAHSVTAEIDAASVDTKQEQRDAHVRSADFLDVENHPVLTFVSTGVKSVDGGDFVLDGTLTIRGTSATDFRPCLCSTPICSGIATAPQRGRTARRRNPGCLYTPTNARYAAGESAPNSGSSRSSS